MKSSNRRAVVGVAAASLLAGVSFAPVSVASAAEGRAEPVRLVVSLSAGVDAEATLPSLSRLGLASADAKGGSFARKLLAEVRAKSIEVPGNKASAVMAALRSDPAVASVRIDPVATASAVTPNDPLYTAGNQRELGQVNVPAAWDTTTGAKIRVAVVDTGVSSVGDLAGKVLPGRDFYNYDDDASDDGVFPHGTVVASLIAAAPNNGSGMAGVCAQCEILPVKVLGSGGSGHYTDIAEGVIYAAKQNAKIINLSLGGPASDPVLKDAIAYANGKGALVVAAAGNEGNTVKQYPAAYADVLAVGGTNTRTGTNSRVSFSSYGSSWVDVAAPAITAGMYNDATYCYDTTSSPASCRKDGNYKVQGTSFSAPLVSGIAALVASKNPKYAGWSLGNAITQSAKPIGSWVKYGLVDAKAALAKGNDTTAPTFTSFSPAANAKVHGTVAVSTTGLKDAWSGIRNVDLYVDGKWHSWDYTSPFQPKLNTAKRNGAIKIQVRYTDKAGNIRWSAVRTVIADNKVPTVTVTKAPANKAKVKGTVTVKGKASDANGIAKVQLMVNGKVVATTTKASYSLSFKVAKQKKTMKVRVRAYDKAGNVKYTATRTYKRA
ncbi:S8 family serine peptidase [Actinoplanes sp. NBRC 101535]|uniref:S8 family serine peptidase n=1 Tax=Actinoplanes sp. NBRC 101535 TaxID=3032196 RepID=UPI0024A2937C|nr:S8 family serine peptidase [Actinoplanes sp. NBRC 101535]GLY00911.1 hypothetical protein Acsp01_12900 [Actinoplanes sp. NBRC 101535]